MAESRMLLNNLEGSQVPTVREDGQHVSEIAMSQWLPGPPGRPVVLVDADNLANGIAACRRQCR